MKSQFNITIIGAGITGLMFAALLTRGQHAASLNIKLIDAASRPTFFLANEVSLRVSAIANGSAEILNSVGAWSLIKQERVSPYQAMRVWDENDNPDGAAALCFDAAEFAVPQLGYIVENALIQDALLRILDDSNVTLSFDTKITAMPEADLVVGSDGARSLIRELANIKTNKWPYHQTAVVTHLKSEYKHKGVARQRFLHDGPLGMLPLADDRVSIVWSTNPDEALRVMELSDDEFGQILTDASDGVLGRLTVAGPKGVFPLCAQHAENYVKTGIALIGDAAHAIHPLAGQGANLGLQDAAELADVIDTAISNGLHPGDRPVLRRYERARKGPNLTMLHLMTGLNRLFTSDSGLMGKIRMTGMRIFNRSGPVRKHAVKVALGVQ
ncbi:MAG: UbiH/UbiF/VisC/COQ6 family ubiquinone biosynthesis hydroxylase [Woeseiaceae bacterium]|nr:UbiH/UbiF/VisC/COQ6 family ubiquinone biosynthesis hydroxylase [Woeseiaceae bacterium]